MKLYKHMLYVYACMDSLTKQTWGSRSGTYVYIYILHIYIDVMYISMLAIFWPLYGCPQCSNTAKKNTVLVLYIYPYIPSP